MSHMPKLVHRTLTLAVLGAYAASPAGAVEIAAGTSHVLLIDARGQLYASGSDANGRLGRSDPLQPTPLTLPEPIVGLSSLNTASLAWTATGDLYVWGDRRFGQLGLPFEATETFKEYLDAAGPLSAPAKLASLGSPVIKATTNGYSTSILVADGRVFVAGVTEATGAYPIAYTAQPLRPGPIGVLPWANVAQGGAVTMAVQQDGSLWAWGTGSGLGQPGNGNYTEVPLQIAPRNPEPDWQSIAGGDDVGYGVRADGSLWAWGTLLNSNGSTRAQHPDRFAPSLDWHAVIANQDTGHALAIKRDGSLWGWGRSYGLGELGPAPANSVVPNPSPLYAGQRWLTAGVSFAFSAAIRDDHSLWLCGLNSGGQLGQGDTVERRGRQQILPGHCWQAVAPSTTLVHALDCEGTVYNWGLSAGIGRGLTRPAPISSTQTWVSVAAAGGRFSTAVDTEGGLWLWSSRGPKVDDSDCADGDCPLPTQIAKGDFVKVWARDNGTVENNDGGLIALDQTGTAWALGRLEELTDTAPLTRLTALPGQWRSFAFNADTTLAIGADGSLWSAGFSRFGETCRGASGSAYPLATVGQDKDWTAVAMAESSAYALKQDGSLWACGDNHSGQLGTGNRTDSGTPVQVAMPVSVAQVAAGKQHALALGVDGSLWAWGLNDFGQLGLGTHEPHAAPRRIGKRNDWVRIAAAGNHSYAVDTSGQVWGFGANEHGQLGTGDIEARNQPVAMQPFSAP